MKIRNKCLCCKKEDLKEIIKLGSHSFADRFISKKGLSTKDPLYPLVVVICKSCSFIQLKYVTNPKDRYSTIDYSYTSSNSAYSRKHWNDFFLDSKKIISRFKFRNVMEIGANDGYLSEIFLKNNYNVLAIDASNFMVNLIKKKKIKSENLIFNYSESKKIKKKYGKHDLVIANNVFNHADNPSNFLLGVKNILNDNGMFIFEQPYFANSVKEFKFDQIYHEHISYFTIKNIKNLLKNNGFKIFKISFNKYHGGSIRTAAVLDQSIYSAMNLKKILAQEEKTKVNNINFYKEFEKNIINKKKTLLKKINNLIIKKYKIFGVGAAAKANTLLTFYDLNSEKINFITDGSKYKINKYTPKTRIKIVGDQEVKKYDKIACIILAWNISNLLIKKLKKINKNIKFLKL